MGKCRLDEDEKKSKAAKAPKKTGGTNRAKAGGSGGKKAAAKKRATGKPKTPEPDDKAEYRGAKKALRRAVKKVVKAKCDAIAQTLVEKTEGGDMRSAALVITLMDKKKDGGDDEASDGPSAAELLASEPEWDEEAEKKQETGNREQGAKRRENSFQLSANSYSVFQKMVTWISFVIPQGLKPPYFHAFFGPAQVTPATKTCRWGPRQAVPLLQGLFLKHALMAF